MEQAEDVSLRKRTHEAKRRTLEPMGGHQLEDASVEQPFPHLCASATEAETGGETPNATGLC